MDVVVESMMVREGGHLLFQLDDGHVDLVISNLQMRNHADG